MKVIHINTIDNLGGAARAAFRLHRGIREQDCDSLMFVAAKHSDDAHVNVFQPQMDLLSRLRRRLRRELIDFNLRRYHESRLKPYEIFSDDRTQHQSGIFKQLPTCDVINLHWITRFIDYKYFFNHCPKHIPIIWTLHDMNAFTGGCHYNQGCYKYNNTCQACPQLGSKVEQDLSYRIWIQKKKIFDNIPSNRLHFVAPSKWMAQEVKRSSLLGRFPVSVIPNSLDTNVFSPRDRAVCRDAIEVPYHARVILFVSNSTENRVKGFPFLTQALEGLQDMKDLFLISIGSGAPQKKPLIPYLHLGHIENDRLLSLVYSVSDIFIIPSIQDNLPNTVLESMACGTPVVGFDVGGISDMVRPRITGFLAPPQEVNNLRHAIQEALDNSDRLKEMRVNCRQVAVDEYSVEIQARSHIALYQEIIEKMS